MKINLVSASDVWWVWASVAELCQTAAHTSNGRLGPNDLLQLTINQHIQMWVVEDAAVEAVLFTRVIDYPKSRKLSVHFAAGFNMTEWIQVAIIAISEYAKQHQCDGIEIIGRPGWMKMLKKYSPRIAAVQIEIPLTG